MSENGLNYLFEKFKVDYKELVYKSGVNIMTISKMRNNAHFPRYTTILKLRIFFKEKYGVSLKTDEIMCKTATIAKLNNFVENKEPFEKFKPQNCLNFLLNYFNLKIADIEKKTGFTSAHISNIRNNVYEPSYLTILIFCKFFNDRFDLNITSDDFMNIKKIEKKLKYFQKSVDIV